MRPIRTQSYSTEPAFSCFDWVEKNLAPTEAIRRCFSLARSLGMKSFVVEDIQSAGLIDDENEEIGKLTRDHSMPTLKRISFWDKPTSGPVAFDASALCGYAILKHDKVPSRQLDRWHVFEAVFKKYPHEHNCVPSENNYKLRVYDNEYAISGVLYAQQNSLNKVCAHVALRTLLSRRLPDGDVPYSMINRLAAAATTNSYKPSNGLGVSHIRAVLKHFNIPFRDIDYSQEDKSMRQTHPFQNFIYAGIESGCGALLGFRMTGPSASLEKHIIPFYGHTFNKDTWVPDADMAYFNVGGGIGYIPSESWTSSFLGHDDNFGPNLCIPRLYVEREQAEYVVELLKDGVEYSGVHAEAIALIFLYSLRPHLTKSKNSWIRRLVKEIQSSRVVLRAVCVSKDAYLQHICDDLDWDGNKEDVKLTEIIKRFLPQTLWLVEISLPHLFPANERKLGEVVLNPFVSFDLKKPIDYNLFMLARLPANFFFIQSATKKMPNFMEVPSSCTSHKAVFKI